MSIESDPPLVRKRSASSIGASEVDPLGQVDHGLVGEVAEGRVRLELGHLGGHGVDDLLAAMAHVAVPQAGRGIEVAPARIVPDVVTVGPVDHQLAGLVDRLHVGERMPVPTGAH